MFTPYNTWQLQVSELRSYFRIHVHYFRTLSIHYYGSTSIDFEHFRSITKRGLLLKTKIGREEKNSITGYVS